MYGYTPTALGDPIGPTGIPLLDSYLELYDSAGNLITAADGGSDTVLNGANSGFDALLTFTATTTGTYFVNARAFDNLPDDGDDGDMVGDYGLYAEDVTGDESLYTPYYSPDSPLYAIDWGTQVNKIHQTYRNPDGNEGTRDTGNAPSPVDPGALLGHPGKNVISIYFAQAGDIFVSNDPTNPGLPPATITATGVQAFEHHAVMTALHEFEKVADLVYVEVDGPRPGRLHLHHLYRHARAGRLAARLDEPARRERRGPRPVQLGRLSLERRSICSRAASRFVTLIHEFGHGHGLAHPHDNGGHSGIMNGVEAEGAGVADYTTGDFHLNQSRVHDDVLRGRLAGFALRQCRDRRRLRLSGRADGVRHRRHPGQIWRQRGHRRPATTPTCSRTSTRRAPIIRRSGMPAASTPSPIAGASERHISTCAPPRSNMKRAAAAGCPIADGIFGGFTIANGVDDRECHLRVPAMTR